MTNLRDPDDLLMGGGVPSCTFPEIGTTWKGQVLAKETQQQRDFQTGAPKFYDDGAPMQQVAITLQTDVRDPNIENDDGQRKLYVKSAMLAAVRDAVRAAGAKTVEIGGTLAVQYTGDGVAKTRGQNPPKEYRAQYVAPVASVATGDLL